MKTFSGTAAIFVALSALVPIKASAQCDQFIGTVLSKHLRPVIESADCPLPGLDKKGHNLVGVCYQSSGPTSHIIIDTYLNCYASGESVVSKLFGAKNAPSVSENVSVEADVNGADCHLNYVNIKPSGELGKVLAALFDANGKAREALEQGLADACKK
jgi:hypothetical protein